MTRLRQLCMQVQLQIRNCVGMELVLFSLFITIDVEPSAREGMHAFINRPSLSYTYIYCTCFHFNIQIDGNMSQICPL